MSEQDLVRAPLYLQLSQTIHSKHIAGKKAGELLLSEHEIASIYKVSRTTIRKAIDLLERKNIVRRRQGSGTYIQDIRLPERDIALLMDLDVSMTGLSPYYPKLLQEARLELFKAGISSRPYLGHVSYGANLDELTCREISRDLNLNRINGMISVSAHPHASWISEFRMRAVPTVGGNNLMDHTVETNKPKVADQILSYFRADGKVRVMILDWNHDSDDDLWFTKELASKHGLLSVECRIPILASPCAVSLAWRTFAEAWQGGSDGPDCLIVADDMLFEECQKIFLENNSLSLDSADIVVYGSDAVNLAVRLPITRCIYSVKSKAQKMVQAIIGRLEGREVEPFIEVPTFLVPADGASGWRREFGMSGRTQ